MSAFEFFMRFFLAGVLCVIPTFALTAVAEGRDWPDWIVYAFLIPCFTAFVVTVAALFAAGWALVLA